MNAENLFNVLKNIPQNKREQLSVFVKTEGENSIGGASGEYVENVVEGFDWDTGKLIFFPQKSLIHKTETSKPSAKKFIRIINENEIIKCSNCKVDVGKYDKYCPNCGNKFEN